MIKILHVSCSPRGPASESDRLARGIVERLLRHAPSAALVRRALGEGGVPHIDGDYALGQHSATAPVPHNGSSALSDALIEELEDADAVVIGTPMHNLSVPSALKAWIDHVVRARRTFRTTAQGKVGLLRDRPVFVAVASGGRYSGERARQPDFLTPYLRAVLGTIGLRDLHFFSVQGSGLGDEAVAQARQLAEQALDAYFSSARLALSPSSPRCCTGPRDTARSVP